MNKRMLSVPNKLLIAAVRLEEKGESPFTTEMLTISVWKEFPQDFGMAGYEDIHPDMNKVVAAIVGVRGVVSRNLLHKIAPKTFRLSVAGRDIAYQSAELCDVQLQPRKELPDNTIPKDTEEFLRRTLDSYAMTCMAQSASQEITFTNACAFWNLEYGVGTPLIKFQNDLELAKTILLATREMVSMEGRSFTYRDAVRVEELDQYLTKRYDKHLKVYKSRGKRKV